MAFRILRPQACAAARFWRAARRKWGIVEQRAYGAEAEGSQRRLGVPAQQVRQQRGDQRSMHDKPGIALDLGRVAAIIMDAVTDEDHRRIAKQHHRISMDITPPDRAGRRWRRLRRHFAGAGRLAVHNVVLLDQRETYGPGDLMPHQHEDQWPDTTIFRRDIGDRGLADDSFADEQRPMEFEPRAGPHTAWQRDRRQEPAALWMPVGSDFRLAHGRQEVKPVPERRQFIARPRLRIIAVERGSERCDRDRRDQVLYDFFAADPRSQMLDVYRQFSISDPVESLAFPYRSSDQ